MVKVKTLGKKHSYSHKYNCALNTTSNFGYEQPVFVRALAKDDKISISPNIVTRCSPMVAAAMANFNTHIRATFVPYSDVFRAYDAVKTGMNYSNHNTKLYPLISNNMLFMWLLATNCFSFVPFLNTSSSGFNTGSVYWAAFDNYNYITDILNDCFSNYYDEDASELIIGLDFDSFLTACGADTTAYNIDSTLTAASEVKSTFPNGTSVTTDSFDVVFHTSQMSQYSSTGWSIGLIANNKGKQLIKLLRGVGYNPLAYFDNDRLSALSLMCLAKALYYMNSIQQETNWTNTLSFKFFDNLGIHNNFTLTPEEYPLWNWGLELLQYSVHTLRTDSWTVCRKKASYTNMLGNYSSMAPENIPSTGGKNQSNVLSPNSDLDLQTDLPVLPSDVRTNALAIQTLFKLTKYFNSASVFGQKISAYLKSKGYDVDETMFNDTPIIYDKRNEVSINEVFSNTDTYDGTNGSELGAYAGRGASTTKDNFSFTARKDGLLIMWYSIIPRVGHCLSTSPYLYNVNRYNAKDSMFDSLGIELSPTMCHEQSLPRAIGSSITLGAYQNTGFGYQPRLTMWKQIPDVLNGDMSLNSYMNTYLPYHDEFIYKNMSDIAIGDWTRKPWIVSDYNRYFYTVGQLKGEQPLADGTLNLSLYNTSYDNFLVQGMFYVTERNQLKPISESYDTQIDGFSESHGELV